MKHLILGTAGHIDHGKTSLVRRLTGINTSRLPEEKKRGITIDLGFANLDLPQLRFGIIDVPGHERFIHNMVSGAGGIDAALLVVAADDSVMPQTIEHLAILRLLGVGAGIVAISKSDLVDDDILGLVREDVKNLLGGTMLENAPIVAVSSRTGHGIDELRLRLQELGERCVRRRRNGPFRLPVDRSFSLPGHGTIVTGTVHGGSTSVGAELEVVPGGTRVRIRGLQTHSSDADRVEAGQRAAINLTGVRHDEVGRGDEIAATGYLRPARRILAEVHVLANASRPLKTRTEVLLHLGTRAISARVIIKNGAVESGASGLIELRSSEWMIAEYGQRFIIRQPSPAVTIGGGQVLDPCVADAERIRSIELAGQKLSAAEPLERLAGYLETHDLESIPPLVAAAKLGIHAADFDSLIEKLLADKRLAPIGVGKADAIHRVRREELRERIASRCRREIERRQPCRAIDRATLVGACRRLAERAVIEAVLDEMLVDGKLATVGDKIGPPGQRSSLTKAQQKAYGQLMALVGASAACPKSPTEIEQLLGLSTKEVALLLRVATDDLQLVRVAAGIYYLPGQLEEFRTRLDGRFRDAGAASIAEIRDLLGVTRKYAVPLCEYFDKVGVTVRHGDLRSAGPRIQMSLVDAGGL